MNVLYTCITGGYDRPIVPTPPLTGYKRVLVTDEEPVIRNRNHWFDEVILLDEEGDRQRLQRRVKLMSHVFFPDADETIYIDGNVSLNRPASRLLDLAGDSVFAVPKHPERNCVYREAERIKQLNKDNADVVDQQIADYLEDGWPERAGLYATRILVWRKSEEVRNLEEAWWGIIDAGSVRDQLSLPLALDAVNMKPKVLPAPTKLGIRIRPHIK